MTHQPETPGPKGPGLLTYQPSLPCLTCLPCYRYNDPIMPAVCAFCRKQPVDPRCRPFCSQRCRLQDLARWVDGSYKIPGDPVTEDGDLEREELEDHRHK
jgi:endogenous inhibitor of DNA gyrase (YacG/DUF329 family)